MSVFSGRHVRAVRSVQGVWPDARLVVVGGLAVAHHTEMSWRTTRDLDLAIGIEVEEFPGTLDATTDWDPDPDGRENRRLFEENIVKLDLPADEAAAFLIGSDIAEIADERCLSKIREFRDSLNAGQLDLAAVMCGMRSDVAQRLWAAMVAGLEAR